MSIHSHMKHEAGSELFCDSKNVCLMPYFAIGSLSYLKTSKKCAVHGSNSQGCSYTVKSHTCDRLMLDSYIV